MNCPKCKRPIPEKSTECPSCGTLVIASPRFIEPDEALKPRRANSEFQQTLVKLSVENKHNERRRRFRWKIPQFTQNLSARTLLLFMLTSMILFLMCFIPAVIAFARKPQINPPANGNSIITKRISEKNSERQVQLVSSEGAVISDLDISGNIKIDYYFTAFENQTECYGIAFDTNSGEILQFIKYSCIKIDDCNKVERVQLISGIIPTAESFRNKMTVANALKAGEITIFSVKYTYNYIDSFSRFLWISGRLEEQKYTYNKTRRIYLLENTLSDGSNNEASSEKKKSSDLTAQLEEIFEGAENKDYVKVFDYKYNEDGCLSSFTTPDEEITYAKWSSYENID